jgi:phage terminase small subunit
MPVLRNPKHELFSQGLASGLSQEQAYERAGYVPDSGHAARLAGQGSIRQRVSEILAPGAERLTERAVEGVDRVHLTKQWVLERLIENASRAMQAVPVMSKDGPTGEYKYDGSVANRSLELLGKELGMFVDRKESGAPGEFANIDNAADLRRAIAERLGLAGNSNGEAGDSRRKRTA